MGARASHLPSEPQVAVVLLAAGEGKRFSGRTPKALAPIAGQPLIALPVRTVAGLTFVEELILVLNAELKERIQDALSPLISEVRQAGIRFVLCEGGRTRSESVHSALHKVSCDYVLIHDGSRPFASPQLFQRVLGAVEPEVGAVPVVEPIDSLLTVHSPPRLKEYLDRTRVRLAQTPQGFITSEYRAARELLADNAPTFMDDGSLFAAAGYEIATVPGEQTNIKITYPHDLALGQELVRQSTGEL